MVIGYETVLKNLWCAREDLNLRPPDSQSGALSTELRAQHSYYTQQVSFSQVAEGVGFEPTLGLIAY